MIELKGVNPLIFGRNTTLFLHPLSLSSEFMSRLGNETTEEIIRNFYNYKDICTLRKFFESINNSGVVQVAVISLGGLKEIPDIEVMPEHYVYFYNHIWKKLISDLIESNREGKKFATKCIIDFNKVHKADNVENSTETFSRFVKDMVELFKVNGLKILTAKTKEGKLYINVCEID